MPTPPAKPAGKPAKKRYELPLFKRIKELVRWLSDTGEGRSVMKQAAHATIPVFTSKQQLQHWLASTADGQAMLANLAARWLAWTPEGKAVLQKQAEQSPREWLETTPEGQAVLLECLARYVPKENVLVVVGSDGKFGRRWVEVYGTKAVRVHIAQRLLTERPEEVLADEYLDRTLPRKFRDVYLPVNLRASDTVSPHTPEQELDAKEKMDVLQVIRQMGDELKEKP